ncbi:MAG: carbohydrate kinase family protein [Thermomicrobium sp.]|nr:carbohydrate kinase family protein [Thermomicrobium sp.]
MTSEVATAPSEAVAILGTTSWDEFLELDRMPALGSTAIVRRRFDAGGGTAANLAVALARLGVRPLLVTAIGDDGYGQRSLEELEREGVVVHAVPRPATPTDRCTILVTPGPERTILWSPGARLRLGDPLPLDRIFRARIIVVDVEELPLRRFLLDLPAHVAPRVQLVGPLTHLATLPREIALRTALQHDVLVGNEEEFCALTGCHDIESALSSFRRAMPLGATRLAAVTRGRAGCVLLTRRELLHCPAFPIEAVDPTGAGDAFAAGLVYGLLERLPLEELGRLANAVGALATRRLGARTALPTEEELRRFLAEACPCS